MRNKYTDDQVLNEAKTFVLRWNNYPGYSTQNLAKRLGVPQSTIWWHLSVRLKGLDPELHKVVGFILKSNSKGGGR